MSRTVSTISKRSHATTSSNTTFRRSSVSTSARFMLRRAHGSDKKTVVTATALLRDLLVLLGELLGGLVEQLRLVLVEVPLDDLLDAVRAELRGHAERGVVVAVLAVELDRAGEHLAGVVEDRLDHVGDARRRTPLGRALPLDDVHRGLLELLE